jgi:hypothetical protein
MSTGASCCPPDKTWRAGERELLEAAVFVLLWNLHRRQELALAR